MRDKKTVLWIVVAAVVFLCAAAALSRCSDDAAKPGVAADGMMKPKVVFPRDDARRKKARQLSNLDTEKPKDARPSPPKDGLMKAVGGGGDGAMFAEVNAIRHSELVTKIMKCRQEEATNQLAKMKSKLGVDPTEDLDRIGFDDEVLAASGFFENLKMPAELGEGTAYGDGARIWKLPREQDDEGKETFAAKVGDDLMVMGDDEAQVRAAIDRAEGRGAVGPAIEESLMKSEVYGTLSPELVKSFLANQNDPISQKIADSVTGGTVRMNIDEHVKLSLDLTAADEATGEDLGKAVGGALAMVRKQALDSGDQELAWLLEQARVLPQGGGKFGVDLAVPGEFVLDKMGCDKEGNKKPGAARPAPQEKPTTPAPPPATPPVPLEP